MIEIVPRCALWNLPRFTSEDMEDFVEGSGLDASGIQLDTSIVVKRSELVRPPGLVECYDCGAMVHCACKTDEQARDCVVAVAQAAK